MTLEDIERKSKGILAKIAKIREGISEYPKDVSDLITEYTVDEYDLAALCTLIRNQLIGYPVGYLHDEILSRRASVESAVAQYTSSTKQTLKKLDLPAPFVPFLAGNTFLADFSDRYGDKYLEKVSAYEFQAFHGWWNNIVKWFFRGATISGVLLILVGIGLVIPWRATTNLQNTGMLCGLVGLLVLTVGYIAFREWKKYRTYQMIEKNIALYLELRFGVVMKQEIELTDLEDYLKEKEQEVAVNTNSPPVKPSYGSTGDTPPRPQRPIPSHHDSQRRESLSSRRNLFLTDFQASNSQQHPFLPGQTHSPSSSRSTHSNDSKESVVSTASTVIISPQRGRGMDDESSPMLSAGVPRSDPSDEPDSSPCTP